MFGDALRALRRERGISQEALALDAGLNRGYYSGVERGVRNISLTNSTKIANALDIPASQILARAETIREPDYTQLSEHTDATRRVYTTRAKPPP